MKIMISIDCDLFWDENDQRAIFAFRINRQDPWLCHGSAQNAWEWFPGSHLSTGAGYRNDSAGDALQPFEDAHLAQAINYLEVYGLQIGLLINFGNRSLQFKRVMKPIKNRPPQPKRNPTNQS
jgi:hypothetical protein